MSCIALLGAHTAPHRIPVGISILHLCPSWGNGHGTQLELTHVPPSPANPRSRDPGVCQATHVARPPCPGTRKCARAAGQASQPGAWARAGGRTSLPHRLPQARHISRHQALTSGSSCGSAAALRIFLRQSLQVQHLGPHQALPNLGGGPHAEEAQGRPCWPQFKSRSGRPHFPLCFLGCHAASGPQQAVTSASPLCRQEQMASPLG